MSNLINSQGGVDGYKIRIDELDNSYQVPPAIEEYERQKQEGAVSMLIWGTPQAQALDPKLEAGPHPRHVAGIRHSRGGERRASTRICSRSPRPIGRRRGAAVQFVKDKLGGSLKGKKIAYLYYDNPAGHGADADPQATAADRGL